jgi:hypothetical protein
MAQADVDHPHQQELGDLVMVPGAWISSAPWNALPADKVWACVAESLGKKRVAVKVSKYPVASSCSSSHTSHVFSTTAVRNRSGTDAAEPLSHCLSRRCVQISYFWALMHAWKNKVSFKNCYIYFSTVNITVFATMHA